MSMGCHLNIQCEKHVNLSGSKAETAYIYKLTLLNFIVSYHLKSKI